MSTAHKPTWKPAIGLSEAKGYVPSRSYSARDQPGYLNLKQRKWGQGSAEELKHRDFKAQLLKREAEANNKKLKSEEEQKMITQQSQAPDFVTTNVIKKIRRPGDKSEPTDMEPIQEDNPFPEDEDSQSFIRSDDQKDLSDLDEQDDDQQLLREFQRVKQQRQLQQRQKMEQKAKYSATNKQSQLLKGNPLLEGGFSLTKRWYQDTVFKNQAKRVDQKKSYVNDNIRSDFHRKFINKYVMR